MSEHDKIKNKDGLIKMGDYNFIIAQSGTALLKRVDITFEIFHALGINKLK